MNKRHGVVAVLAGAAILGSAICGAPANAAVGPPFKARAGPQTQAGATTSRRSRLRKIVRGLVAAGAPGALAVVRTPAGIDRAAGGLASIQPRLAMQPGDRFRVASVTKTFVATLLLRLAAQGRLRLSDSVERWLPRLVPDGGSITLRELLNHTSGLYNYTDDPTWKQEEIANPGRHWLPRELVAFATSHPQLFPAGTSWSYSNTNYILLGLVLEAATGEPLGQELQEQLFQPLALRSTSFPTGTAIDGPYAHGYLGSGSGLVPPGTPLADVSTLVDPSELWAAGGIVSTGDNLTRFYAQLLKGRVLPRAQLKAMETASSASLEYGLGLRLTFTVCGEALGHDGNAPGYRNIVWATANGRRVASVMVNIDTTHVPLARLEGATRNALCHG